jgi:hypothetical protein
MKSLHVMCLWIRNMAGSETAATLLAALEAINTMRRNLM